MPEAVESLDLDLDLEDEDGQDEHPESDAGRPWEGQEPDGGNGDGGHARILPPSLTATLLDTEDHVPASEPRPAAPGADPLGSSEPGAPAWKEKLLIRLGHRLCGFRG